MSFSEQSLKVYETIKQHLQSSNLSFEANDSELVIHMTVTGDDLPQPTIIRVDDKRQLVQVLSPIPGNIPEDKRLDAAVAVSVANYGLVNGCFDFDISDGEICYRAVQSFRGCELADDTIHYLLSAVFLATDRYNDRFFMLGKGMMSLSDFIEKEDAK